MPAKRAPEDPLTKAFKIKINSLKRTVKDLEFAKKEVVKEQERLDKFKSSDPDRVPQQENVLNEAKVMVPDAENRIRIAKNDLSDFIEKEGENIADEELHELAKTTISDAEAAV